MWCRSRNSLIDIGLASYVAKLSAKSWPLRRRAAADGDVLPAERKPGQPTFQWPKELEARREEDDRARRNCLESGVAKRGSGFALGEQHGIGVDRRAAHDPPGDRIPGVVLEDDAASSRTEDTIELAVPAATLGGRNVVKDRAGDREVETL